MRDRLRKIVEDNTTPVGRWFDYIIQVLILISLVAFSIETLPDLPEGVYSGLYYTEMVCVIIFTIEYFLRIYVAKRPFRYIFSFYGLIDLLAILPFYLRMALDLVALRSLHIFRIFRALKLVRFNRALTRFHIAYRIVREELMLFHDQWDHDLSDGCRSILF